MFRTRRILYLALLLSLAFCLPAWAHKGPPQDKTGILLVAFGTTKPEAATAYASFAGRVREAWPDIPVRFAYTSHIVRAELAGTDANATHDSPAMALSRMVDEGFTRIAVQSLHVITGFEYDSLAATVAAMAALPEHPRIALGEPLLANTPDLERLAHALADLVPAGRKPGEAVIFFGHGTHHGAAMTYAALQYHLWRADPDAFVGTVEGTPSLDAILPALAAKKIHKAYVVPLMAVAGEHARNDMAGKDAQSWVSRLEAANIEAVPVLRGLMQTPAATDIWLDHLRAALAEVQPR